MTDQHEDDLVTRADTELRAFDEIEAPFSHWLVRDMKDRITDLTRQLTEAREVLKPFAKAVAEWGDDTDQSGLKDVWEHPIAMLVTIGDFRRAFAALNPEQTKS